MEQYRMSERHACRLVSLARSTHRYRARKADRDQELRQQLKELAAKRMRFGYRRLTAMLERQGVEANHKKIYRLYREEGLAMRIRQRRRIRWNGAVAAPAARKANERWSIDFLSDAVSTGIAWWPREVSRKPLFWTMGRSFAVGPWRPGVKNGACG
jgi:putative transposase